VNDLVGIVREDLVGHGIAYVFRDTHEMSRALGCFGRKRSIFYHVIYWFPEMIVEDSADVRGLTVELLQRCTPPKGFGG
jgi:hypothetical protein